MLQQRPTTPLLKQEVLIAQHIVLCKSSLLHTAPDEGNNPLMFSTHHLHEASLHEESETSKLKRVLCALHMLK